VQQISEATTISVIFDGSRDTQVVARSALMKAPPPTPLKKGDLVRYPCDDHALEGTTRWQYGKVVKVYPGGELIDVDFDNGEDLHRQPTHDVLPARA